MVVPLWYGSLGLVSVIFFSFIFYLHLPPVLTSYTNYFTPSNLAFERGPERTEQGGTQDEARDDLSNNPLLADPTTEIAAKVDRQDDDDQLEKNDAC